MNNRALTFIVLAVSVSLSVRAQTTTSQPGTQQSPQPNAPLELPDFLVTGKALVDVASAAKHVPTRPPT